MPRILIVDDEEDIVNLISRYAVREGYEVDTACDGSEAIEICETKDYDAIIMDVMMQDVDGFTACKKIRAQKDIPVIMLSAKGTEVDKLYGFEIGVDDYVTKPFSPRELMARINVVIKRRHVDKPQEPADDGRFIEAGGIRLDVLGHGVFIKGEKYELTAKEYDLLLYLIRNKGIVLSRDQIMNEVWGYDYFGEDRIVDWQIKLLRSKLGDSRDRIRTIRGVGYKFEE